MSRIPSNQLQKQLHDQANRSKRPSINGTSSVSVEIVKVYDSDVLLQDGVEDRVAPKVLSEPGTLWARVKLLRSNREIVVGFKESESHILFTYGNSSLLEGMYGVVEYTGMRPENGRLIVTGSPKRALRGINATTVVFDISGVI